MNVTGAPDSTPPDIRFVDARLQLQPLEVAGDDEQRRRLQAGRHRLADFHGAAQTMPSVGDLMTVCDRLTLACVSAASAWVSCARAPVNDGLGHPGVDRAVSTSCWASNCASRELFGALQLELRVLVLHLRALDFGLQPDHVALA